MNDLKKPLADRVQEWLAKHGYPLEMTVAKTFKDAGTFIDQSIYYLDPETDTPREIDVVAGWRDGEFADYFMFSVLFCIECKKSNVPWVVFASPDGHKPSAFHRGWICSKIGQDVKDNLPPQATYQHRFHHWERPWGTGMTTALRETNDSNNDAPYKAMMGATKAAYAIAKEADSRKWNDDNERVLFGAMTLPVVVLDGTLFEAMLGESGDIEVKQVDESIVLFRYPFSPNEEEGIAIRVVTLPKLKDFAERAKDVEDIITNCKDVQTAAYKKYHRPKRSLSELRDASKKREIRGKRTPDIGER